ncbi:hypothetical protein Rsub_10407 [Raphidocelis subcapitata]|uniref:Bacterial surface antigen (D15) domain-containing protein n=1 Tax=Raphidocelis subcapitata TaxID=307507 RepID=A0A2V0PCA8_9CHLO|nr:hypothetical protein Rsub_10407 [Raphidocelis subcapitata]|eukprot:GBF97484.1 hypothetical protein Rsub_10407 [Raphidocelis subcapitata]
MTADGGQPQPGPGQQQRDAADLQHQAKLEAFRRRTHDMYEAVAEKPLSVTDVRVDAHAAGGADAPRGLRTRQAILERELQRVYDAKSLREVHAALETAVEHLQQLEAFRRIDALIDEDPRGAPDACSVQLDLQERGWYSGGVQTFMQANEGLVQANVALRNLFGAADQWRLTAEYGHRSSFDFAALFRLPRAGGRPWTPDVGVFRRSLNLEPYSSLADTMRGLELGVSSADGATRLSYTWGWRSLVAGAAASRPVRAQRGDFLSDALRWTWVVDERDSATVHTEGWGTRLASELGGLFPGAGYRYAKQRLDWVWAAPVNDTVAVNVSIGGGLIAGLSGGASPAARPSGGGGGGGGGEPSPRDAPAGARPATYIGERFFLGGADSVRGFAYRGLGPSAERARRRDGGGGGGAGGGGDAGAGEGPARDALGGDLFASLYAGLITRLPGQLGDIGGCAHAFINGGSSSLLSSPPAPLPAAFEPPAALGGAAGAAARRVAELAASCRWSAGLGLVLPTPFGRFEANYVWVLSSQPGDLPKAGMQFGFAASPIAPAGPM